MVEEDGAGGGDGRVEDEAEVLDLLVEVDFVSALASSMFTSRLRPRVFDALFSSRILLDESVSGGGNASQRTCVGCIILGRSIRFVWIS